MKVESDWTQPIQSSNSNRRVKEKGFGAKIQLSQLPEIRGNKINTANEIKL